MQNRKKGVSLIAIIIFASASFGAFIGVALMAMLNAASNADRISEESYRKLIDKEQKEEPH